MVWGRSLLGRRKAGSATLMSGDAEHESSPTTAAARTRLVASASAICRLYECFEQPVCCLCDYGVVGGRGFVVLGDVQAGTEKPAEPDIVRGGA